MLQIHIAGAWEEGLGAELRSFDPSVGSVVWEGRAASEAQVDRAFLAARGAFAGWSRLELERRIDIIGRFGALLETHRGALAGAISLETGKPTWEALTEVDSMCAKIDISVQAHAERTGTTERDLGEYRSAVRHRPQGVLAVLGPYNFPGHLPNGHIVPALIAGNTVVFKPSEHTPWTAVETTRLWEEAGLPPGVLNLVLGAKEVGAATAAHRELDGLLFTGSATVGHELHRQLAGSPDKILALEMGGNNPLVLERAADIDAAIYIIVQSAYVTAGQRCTCARRLLVPRDAFGRQLVGRLAEATRKLRVGRFDDPEPPFMGPVISEQAANALVDAQANIVALGGEPILTLRKLKEGTGFVSPGLIDVTGVTSLPDEEHFGPLLQLAFYEDFDRAVDMANETRFGLAAGLIGGERTVWERFRERIRAGVVNWNRPLTGASSAAPFGGVGASGNHRPSAYYAADYCAHPVASLEQDLPKLPAELPPGMEL
ncbi:MAG: succinylglutamate-semialdehyde dehydrogenase [Myxococcales bacterium SG8_38]|nr:MAG: succinylglutamate-semialdehyde dehydrogenase [Myxococcales bacterium SG8_38]